MTTWLLFGVANVALCIYAEKHAEWPAITPFWLTALADFGIVDFALVQCL